MLIAISTLVLLVIAAGVWFRKRPEIHIPLMAAAFAIDLGLLLYIEFSRHAIETLSETIQTTSQTPAQEGLLLFHVAISALMLVLYIVQIITGIQLFRGSHPTRLFHRYSAVLFVVCRLLNYATSFFVVPA